MDKAKLGIHEYLRKLSINFQQNTKKMDFSGKNNLKIVKSNTFLQ